MRHNVLYVHGFNSSPLSVKAEQTKDYLAKHLPNVGFYCPQLATTPIDAITQLEDIIYSEQDCTWHLIGSSLGGYFSNYLSEKFQLKAVLVNPAVKPYELLADYIGEQKNPYTEEVFFVRVEHMSQLKALEQAAPSVDCKQKNNYLVMVQTGDEVLDYQQAVDKYQHCRLIVQQGGDHSFVGYEKNLAAIVDFFQLT